MTTISNISPQQWTAYHEVAREAALSPELYGEYGRDFIFEDMRAICSLLNPNDSYLNDLKAAGFLITGDRMGKINDPALQGTVDRQVITPFFEELKSKGSVDPKQLTLWMAIWIRDRDAELRSNIGKYITTKTLTMVTDNTERVAAVTTIEHNQIRYTTAIIRRMSNLIKAKYPDKAVDMDVIYAAVSKGNDDMRTIVGILSRSLEESTGKEEKFSTPRVYSSALFTATGPIAATESKQSNIQQVSELAYTISSTIPPYELSGVEYSQLRSYALSDNKLYFTKCEVDTYTQWFKKIIYNHPITPQLEREMQEYIKFTNLYSIVRAMPGIGSSDQILSIRDKIIANTLQPWNMSSSTRWLQSQVDEKSEASSKANQALNLVTEARAIETKLNPDEKGWVDGTERYVNDGFRDMSALNAFIERLQTILNKYITQPTIPPAPLAPTVSLDIPNLK